MEMFAVQRISVAEPLENIGQLVRLNLCRGSGGDSTFDIPTRGGGGQSMGMNLDSCWQILGSRGTAMGTEWFCASLAKFANGSTSLRLNLV